MRAVRRDDCFTPECLVFARNSWFGYTAKTFSVAVVAQLVERRTRNAQVKGSSPFNGSRSLPRCGEAIFLLWNRQQPGSVTLGVLGGASAFGIDKGCAAG